MEKPSNISQQTLALGEEYTRHILSGRGSPPSLVETLRGKPFSELYAYHDILDQRRQKKLSEADYNSAAKFRDIIESFRKDFLS